MRLIDRPGAMPSDTLDASMLYSTEHGAIDWVSDTSFRLTLGEREWTFHFDNVCTLHDAVQSLAAQVYRCNCECRWQLRLESQTIVLETDEVLQLHSLLHGGMAMIELYSVLDDASIAQSC